VFRRRSLFDMLSSLASSLTIAKSFPVSLSPAGRFASIPFVYEATEEINDEDDGRNVVILYIGDYDPAGVLIDPSFTDGSHGGEDQGVFARLAAVNGWGGASLGAAKFSKLPYFPLNALISKSSRGASYPGGSTCPFTRNIDLSAFSISPSTSVPLRIVTHSPYICFSIRAIWNVFWSERILCNRETSSIEVQPKLVTLAS
jgi:hypothetical protein